MHRAFVVAVAGVLLFSSACGDDEPITEARSSTPTPAATADTASSGTSMSAGSCVEQYSLGTLKNRDYAFDGIIREIQPDAADGPDAVVFEVGTWFTGGTGDTAVKKAYGFGGGMTTTAGGSSHKVGDRLLVAGDEDFLWECGFTQPYDADVAADWDAALD